MAALFPELAPHWQIYAPDLRGHGGSGWAPGRYRLSDYADDVVAFLEQRVREPAVLFGYSIGGIVAIVIAARVPALVRGLIVGDSPLSRESWGASLLIQADSAYGGLMADAEVERAKALLPSAAHVRLKGIGHGLHGESKQPVAEAIQDFLGALKAGRLQRDSVGE